MNKRLGVFLLVTSLLAVCLPRGATLAAGSESVEVAFRVTRDGSVEAIRISRASARERLDGTAVDAVRRLGRLQ